MTSRELTKPHPPTPPPKKWLVSSKVANFNNLQWEPNTRLVQYLKDKKLVLNPVLKLDICTYLGIKLGFKEN